MIDDPRNCQFCGHFYTKCTCAPEHRCLRLTNPTAPPEGEPDFYEFAREFLSENALGLHTVAAYIERVWRLGFSAQLKVEDTEISKTIKWLRCFVDPKYICTMGEWLKGVNKSIEILEFLAIELEISDVAHVFGHSRTWRKENDLYDAKQRAHQRHFEKFWNK